MADDDAHRQLSNQFKDNYEQTLPVSEYIQEKKQVRPESSRDTYTLLTTSGIFKAFCCREKYEYLKIVFY